jgi:hypothetical protein
LMMLVIGLSMTCSEAANKLSMTTGWVDLPSGCRFLPLSGAKNKKKSVTNTTEPAKEDVKTGKA